MNKLLGYGLSALGLLGLAMSNLNSSVTKAVIPFAIPSVLSKYILLLSLSLIVLGIVFLVGDSGRGRQKTKEVPIYEGKKIVGYRREK
jgi:hypothetical protein